MKYYKKERIIVNPVNNFHHQITAAIPFVLRIKNDKKYFLKKVG